MIAIIDYGMGNIHSVNKAIQLHGAKTIVTNNAKDISSADKAILPGVGAFDDAMKELKKQGLIPVIKDFIKSKRPFLGICLGLQLFFDSSKEAREFKGLSVFAGTVEKFKEAKGQKVPHMGWNQLKIAAKDCLLLQGIPDGSFVYFCHSYYPKPKVKSIVAATADYGQEFASVVWKDNVYGVQFHPEKSQEVGLKMLENFVKLC